jgi:hypothetical protein
VFKKLSDDHRIARCFDGDQGHVRGT